MDTRPSTAIMRIMRRIAITLHTLTIPITLITRRTNTVRIMHISRLITIHIISKQEGRRKRHVTHHAFGIS